MKTSKEFFERLQNDEAFAKEIGEAVAAKREAGAESYYETFIPVAEERGYEISREELDAIHDAQAAAISDEELGKVAGGASCFVVVSFLTVIGVSVTIIATLNEASVDMPDID